MGVILDVVYNHFGPEGNYLRVFSDDYFTERYETDWGDAINFDGPNSGPVREFFISNARYWIEEYHFDGFRFDATQSIFDQSAEHILGAIGKVARAAAGQRAIILVAENEPQETKLVRPTAEGGYGLDALWNDDLHHSAVVALTGRNPAYYTDYRGTPQEFISAVKHGYLYQGQHYRWQKKRRGTPSRGLAAGSVCRLHREPRPDRKLRPRRTGARHDFSGPLPRPDRAAPPGAVDADAFPGPGVWCDDAVSLLRRHGGRVAG